MRLFYFALAFCFALVCGAAEPPSPGDLTTEIGGQITLRWNDLSLNEDGFIIERSEDGAAFSEIARTAANIYKFIDANALPSRKYWYRVAAFNGAGISPATNVITGVSNGRLINISTRGYVGKNDAVMIVGFVLTDKSSKILARGVGPTLANFGLAGTITDPKVELYRGQTLLLSNDNWGNNPEVISLSQKLLAFALQANSKDAAFVTTLEAGAYTIIMRGVNDVEGLGIMEVYQVY